MNSKNAMLLYFLILIASISIGVIDSTLINPEKPKAIIYNAVATPYLVIDYPNDQSRIHENPFTLLVTTYVSEGGYSITGVTYILKNNTFQSSPIALTKVSGEDRYTKSIDISHFTSGEYQIIVTSTSSSAEFTIRSNTVFFAIYQILYVSSSEINYISDHVQTYSSTSAIPHTTGNCTILNNNTIQSLDLELHLPTEFAEAYNYEIVRGFKVYNPQIKENEKTQWTFFEYQYQDSVYFSIDVPTKTLLDYSYETINDINHYYEEFSFNSKHDFTNIEVTIPILQQMQADSNWNLKIRFEANFEDVDKGAYNFSTNIDEFGFNGFILFTIPEMHKGETFVFRLYGTDNPRISANYEPLIYGVAGLFVGFLMGIVGLYYYYNGKVNKGELDEVPNRKLYLYGFLIGLAVFGLIVGISYLIIAFRPPA